MNTQNITTEEELKKLLYNVQTEIVLLKNTTLLAFFFSFKNVVTTPDARSIHTATEKAKSVLFSLQNGDPCKVFLIECYEEILKNIKFLIDASGNNKIEKVFFYRLEITKILGRAFDGYPPKK